MRAKAVAASDLPDCGFPIDRSLVGAASRRQKVSVPLGGEAAPSLREVAFSALFIFSRMVGREALSAPLLKGFQDGMQAVAEIGRESTLAEAFASCRIVPVSALPEIGLTISERPAHEDEGGPELLIVGSVLSLAFDVSRIAVTTARDFLEKIAIILNALSASPQSRCADIELVTPTARGFIPDMTRPIDAPRPEFVPESFSRIADRYADEIAISNGVHSYSYAQLSRLAGHLARQITEAGIGAGDIVGLSGYSGMGMFAGMLAVMAVGGVFVTLDRALPAERRQLIERISKPRLRLETPDWPTPAEIDALPPHPFHVAPLAADAPAYLFFTSGSTGTPKAVLGTHAGLGHFLEWQRANFPIGPGDRVAQLTALSFDPVLREVFLPLTSGSCLQVPPRDQLLDARRMLRWFSESSITLAHCVPSLMKAWLQADTGGRPFRSLRHVLFAGEPLTDGLLQRFSAASGPDTMMVNLYGPTETTLAKLSNKVNAVEPGVQPVGYPQPGVEVGIFSDQGRRCGLWEVGEIAIRTPYRSKGYLDNPALTAERFRRNRLRSDPDDLIYFTGDLGRFRRDGKVEIFGRSDSQIKIRGVRIEPNEVESAMLDMPGVKDAAVTVLTTAHEEKTLVGLVVAKEGISTTLLQDAREALKSRLIDAMVPGRLLLCDALPYLPNGKIDRRRLAEIASAALNRADSAVAADLSDIERKIAAAWEGSFFSAGIGKDDSFASLGGDSLSYVTAYLSLEDIVGSVPQGWATMPIRQLAALKTAKRTEWLREVESAMILRAMAIIIVVLGHFKILNYSGGATSALLFVSGVIFGQLQLHEVEATRSFSPIFRLIKSILIPYYIIIAELFAWYGLRGQEVNLSGVFLYVDLVNFSDSSASVPNLLEGHLVYLWYIHCIFHMLCIMTAVLYFCRSAKGARWITLTLMVCIAIGILGRLIVPSLISPEFLTSILPNNSIYKLSPMTHIATFSFGALAGFQKGKWREGLFLALALYAFAGIITYGYSEVLFVLTTAFLVMFIPKIKVPRTFGSVMYKIAGSSLFIYLLHIQIYNMFCVRLGFSEEICFALSLMAGYFAWVGWNWSAQNARKFLPRILNSSSSVPVPHRPGSGYRS